jgi:hypothetical protein
MTRTRAALSILAVIATLTCVASLDAQVPVRRGVRVNRDVGMKISVPAGSLRIIAWERDSLHVEGTIGKGSQLYFGGAGSGAKFGVEEPLDGRVAPAAQLTAWVPRGANVSVRTISASIEASDVAGWFTTVSGNIRVSGTASDVQCEAIDGSIDINVIAPHVRARTGGGTVTVAGRVDDLIASTVSGALTITAMGLERGRFESVTGPILIDAPLGRAASIDVDNHNGPVELRVPYPIAADFDLTSVAGTITNLFDKRAPTTGRQGRGQELMITTDPKGTRIVVRTFKGGIVLRTQR